MKSHLNYGEALRGPVLKRAAMALVLLVAAALLAPRANAQSIFLDPNNPFANFEKEGNQSAVPTISALNLNDSSANDHVGFYAATSAAAPGTEVEVTAAFRLITADSLAGVDTGMRFVITDAAATSFIVGCVTLGGLPGVAIAIGNNYSGADNYAGFVPVDWLNDTTLKIRRHADGSGEIIEVNGVAPTISSLYGPPLVIAASMPAPTRGFASVGFGLFADVALTSTEIAAFSAVAVTAVPEPETYAMLLAGLGLLGFAARHRKLKLAA